LQFYGEGSYLIDVSGVYQYLFKCLNHNRGDTVMTMWNANFVYVCHSLNFITFPALTNKMPTFSTIKLMINILHIRYQLLHVSALRCLNKLPEDGTLVPKHVVIGT